MVCTVAVAPGGGGRWRMTCGAGRWRAKWASVVAEDGTYLVGLRFGCWRLEWVCRRKQAPRTVGLEGDPLGGGMCALVTVQLGQCGNQVGEQLFRTLGSPSGEAALQLEENAGNDGLHTFFRERCSRGNSGNRVARAVLVDMEPKAVARTLRCAGVPTKEQHIRWHFDPQRVLVQQSGSGNNWCALTIFIRPAAKAYSLACCGPVRRASRSLTAIVDQQGDGLQHLRHSPHATGPRARAQGGGAV